MKLYDTLTDMTVDKLKKRLKWLNEKDKPTRKDAIIDTIMAHLLGDRMISYWQKLDLLEQQAIAETVHNWHGTFYSDPFYAKYNAFPDSFGSNYKGKKYWELFLYQRMVPDELCSALLKIAPKPHSDTIHSSQEAELVTPPASRRFSTQDKETTESMQCRSMEQVVKHDLHAVLRLVDSGTFSISATTGIAGAASLNKIDKLLIEGDFYSRDEDLNIENYAGGAIRPIRPYAWPLLLQTGGFAKINGNKLALTAAGKKALNQPLEKSVHTLYQRWRDKSSVDELRRVNLIKGQSAKGQVLKNSAERKQLLESALRACPAGEWVSINELYRYMRSCQLFHFELCHYPWKLYLCDPQYGSLECETALVRDRYLLVCLFEYIATLGLIDVAYTTPYFARGGYHSLWGIDEIHFLSRYDGLAYIRLNNLGAYVLDVSDVYHTPKVKSQPLFHVDQKLQIHLLRQANPSEAQNLQLYSKAKPDNNWLLDANILLQEHLSDAAIEEFQHFLSALNDDTLPAEVDKFFTDIKHRRTALRDAGSARLIHCADKKLASMIATNSALEKHCLLVNGNTLVVPEKSLAAFRKGAIKLGFLMQ
ncbi:MAG: hypothetical protein Q9M31_00740 [Mariprofundus sp.]|nr:hypothetical protein [Mariprofundus sp.]